MLNPMAILISSAIISATYFFIDFDWNFWAYVGIYSGFYTLIAIIYSALYISAGLMGGLGAFLYVILNAVAYFVVGMGVVWVLREFKDGSDGKFTIGFGVVVQYMIMLVINGIFGAVFSI